MSHPQSPGHSERRGRPRQGPSLLVLYFSLPGLRLCLPLDRVVKVFPVMRLQEVPEPPPFIAGLVNVAGEVLPVVDLCARLRRPPIRYTLDTPMLLCSDGRRQACVVVEDVLGVAPIDNRQRRMAGLFKEHGVACLSVFDNGSLLTFMLDLSAVFDGVLHDLPTAAPVHPDASTEACELWNT